MEILRDIGFEPPKNPEELRVQTVAFLVKTFSNREVIIDQIVASPSQPSDPETEVLMPESL